MTDVETQIPVAESVEGTCITAADLLVDYFIQLDIDYVFGIPGGAIEPLYNALSRGLVKGGPTAITSRHESGAAFMADGYHRQTKKLGVVCCTTGPGATNALTGVVSAFTNQIPLLIVTAQTPLSTFGRRAFQESSCTGANLLSIFESCTLYNSLVSHIDQLELKLMSAIMVAFSQKKGPVHLSIPMDVLNANLSQAFPKFQLPGLIRDQKFFDKQAVHELALALCKKQRCVLIIGEGCKNAIENILNCAELLEATILTTPLGKGLVDPFLSNFRGVIGFAGHRSALQALEDPEVDAVLCIGATMNEWSSNNWDERILLNRRLIQIDELAINFSLAPMAGTHVLGNIEKIFALLYKLLAAELSLNYRPKHSKIKEDTLPLILDDFASYSDDSQPIHPAHLMAELPKVLPCSTQYFADIGSSFAWAIHYLHPRVGKQNCKQKQDHCFFHTCIEFAAMGWAIGCSVGAALGRKKQLVVCITGDGSILMNGQEMTVAVQENLPVIFVVLNDSALGMVKHGQRLTGAEAIGYEIPATNFVEMANALGVEAYRIESVSDLKQLNRVDFDNHQKPILLDVLVDKEAMPPIGSRTKTLKGL